MEKLKYGFDKVGGDKSKTANQSLEHVKFTLKLILIVNVFISHDTVDESLKVWIYCVKGPMKCCEHSEV